MLKKGDPAPDFEAEDHDGVSHRLSALLEDGPVILYFYPADFSPVCTAQACAFRDRTDSLAALDIRILGISPQSAASHRRFADSYDLEFPLLSDPGKRIIRAYGVDGPLGFGVRRVTFLVDGPVDGSGRIANRVVSDLFVGSHTSFIRSVLESRQTSQ